LIAIIATGIEEAIEENPAHANAAPALGFNIAARIPAAGTSHNSLKMIFCPILGTIFIRHSHPKRCHIKNPTMANRYKRNEPAVATGAELTDDTAFGWGGGSMSGIGSLIMY
jgi:hypothetical protein